MMLSVPLEDSTGKPLTTNPKVDAPHPFVFPLHKIAYQKSYSIMSAKKLLNVKNVYGHKETKCKVSYADCKDVKNIYIF